MRHRPANQLLGSGADGLDASKGKQGVDLLLTVLAGADEGVARYLREVGAFAGEMQAGDHIGAEAFGIGAQQQHFLRYRCQHLLQLIGTRAGGGAAEPQQQRFNGNGAKAKAARNGQAHADQWGQESESPLSCAGSHRVTLPSLGVSLFILGMKLVWVALASAFLLISLSSRPCGRRRPSGHRPWLLAVQAPAAAN